MSNFKGIITALATPFLDSDLDVSSFKKLIRNQREAGVCTFVVNGTTAESPTLEVEEVKRLLDVAHSEGGDDCKLIVGTGTNCTRTTIESTKRIEDWGADAALVVVPYYNKPTQEGLYLHFKAVAESTKLPLFLYNVPGRTVVSMEAETVVKLAKIDNIIGIKEASGDLQLYTNLKEQLPADFLVLSGDDDTWGEMASKGGDGVISVISHLIPNQMVKMFESQHGLAEFKHTYANLLAAVYSEPNPIGVKMALHKLGIFDSPEMRLPMTTMTGTNTDRLVNAMQELELLS